MLRDEDIMSLHIALACLLIFLARIVDVSLGTIRTIVVVQGRAYIAWFLGFCEVLVWVIVVTQVIQNLTNVAYIISYALGFATGNVVGIMIENHVAIGTQIVRIFTRKGTDLTGALQLAGYRVTCFEAQESAGAVSMLFIPISRRQTRGLIGQCGRVDPDCYCIVDDVRSAAYYSGLHQTPTGWRAILKKK
jgi:uncharacterized protein YebE (UPF0316 family)